MAEDLQVCIRTTLPIDRAMEERMCNYFWQLTSKQQLDLGYGGAPNSYIFDSYLWRRLSYMQRHENDFSDRLALPPERGGSLYKMSNKSLNFPKQFVGSYHASSTADLESYGFFAVQPEGGEDEHPALPLWERYLRERAKRMKLGSLLKNESARPMLIRGESPRKVMKRRRRRIEPREVFAVRDQTQPGDVPLRDTRKQIVTELDEWLPDPMDETKVLLARDKRVWKLKDAPPQLTTRKYKVQHVLTDTAGASIEWIHPGDFVFDQTQPTLDACVENGSVVGQFYRMAVDNLFDLFDDKDITLAGKEYREKYGKATSPTGQTTAQDAPKTKQGEGANAADHLTDPGAMPKRLIFEGYWRYDWNDDNRREYVYLVMDWDTKTPIAYDPTSLVLESDLRTHPYGLDAIAKKQFRAYGEGVYERFNDLSESADANYNRIFIEQQTSGKVTVFDRSALTQTWAGAPLILRSTKLWEKKDPNKTLNEIIDTKIIPAETAELRANMQMDISTMVGRGGGVSPAEAESAGLPGASTATGLQILERQKDKLDRSIEDDINQAHADLVQDWAQVECDAFDVAFATGLFKGKMIEVPNPDFETWRQGEEERLAQTATMPPVEAAAPAMAESPLLPVSESPLLPAPPPTIQVPAIQVLTEWLQTVEPDQMRHYIRMVLVKAKESEVASRADNRVRLITQYAALLPPMQIALEHEYTELLMLNGSADAEKTLKDIQRVTQDNLMAQQQAAMQQQAAAGDPTLMPPAEEAPVTGRPSPEPVI